MPALTPTRVRLAGERGFTMIIAMMVMLVVLLLSATAFAAVKGDINIGLVSNKQKVAYAAAEAGLNAYLYQLNTDQNYWRRCDGKVNGVTATDWKTPWVNQPLAANATTDTRAWQALPNSSARFTVELLPATGSVCNPDDPDGTMFDSTTSTFRIRATGEDRLGSKTKRSIVATFKRRGFLDYIYYTDKEDQAPKAWGVMNSCGGTPASASDYPTCYSTSYTSGSTTGTLADWGAQQCSKYWRDGRGSTTFPGTITLGSNTYNYPAACAEIVFGTGEYIKGPFHTNDSIYNCGSPVFGRASDDAIEISDSGTTATRGGSGACSNTPTFTGTLVKGAPLLNLPATNQAMKSDATISLAGPTKLAFNSNGTVTATTNTNGTAAGTTTTTYTLGTNNVIWVDARPGCSTTDYDVFRPTVYRGTTTSADLAMCSDVSVSGTYSKNVTVGSKNDIVITDDITHPSNVDAMLGLVANAFVRVAHDANWDTNGTSGCTTQLCQLTGGGIAPPKCTNANTNTQNINLQAAILAVTGSFTVDKYWCGAGLGTLNVTGAIAQGYRAPVGVSGGSSGFAKNYVYDDRLQFRTPPKFLDPVNSAWKVARQIEQSPATGQGLPSS